MRSGYKLFWSDQSLADLKNILNYLEANWSRKEIRAFSRKLDRRLSIIASNPRLFPATKRRKNVRRSVLTKHTVIYYTITDREIEILTLFDPRQDPSKLKLK